MHGKVCRSCPVDMDFNILRQSMGFLEGFVAVFAGATAGRFAFENAVEASQPGPSLVHSRELAKPVNDQSVSVAYLVRHDPSKDQVVREMFHVGQDLRWHSGSGLDLERIHTSKVYPYDYLVNDKDAVKRVDLPATMRHCIQHASPHAKLRLYYHRVPSKGRKSMGSLADTPYTSEDLRFAVFSVQHVRSRQLDCPC